MSPAAGTAKPAKKAGRKPAARPQPTKPPMARKAVSVEPVAPQPAAWARMPDDAPLAVPAPMDGTHEPFWGAADRGRRILRWPASRFFQATAPAPGVPAAVRVAASPLRLAGVLAVLGFFAVFVHQASLELQIVIGAPVFEEMVKFGLALLAVGAIPRGGRAFPLVALLRVAVAWAVGAGFGWLEHLVSYSEEPREVYIGRVLFHGGATALSMAAYCALEGAADVRLRWFATAPATLLHYANNVGAVALIAAPGLGLYWAAGITAAVYGALLAVPASWPLWRPSAEAWARRRWPLRTPPSPEDWEDARARAAVAARAAPGAAPATRLAPAATPPRTPPGGP